MVTHTNRTNLVSLSVVPNVQSFHPTRLLTSQREKSSQVFDAADAILDRVGGNGTLLVRKSQRSKSVIRTD